MNINNQDTNVWPNLKSNTPSAPTNNATPIWNSDLRQLQEEIHSLKQEYENQIKKLKLDSENQVKLMAQSWQLFNFQSKTQTDAIADIYMTLADVIPSIMNSMQNFNHILKDINKNITNDNERQQRDFVITRIDESINTVNNRLQLMTDHHKNLMIIINKQNELLVRGMNSIDQLYKDSSFHFSSPFVNINVCDRFIGTNSERRQLSKIIEEWNTKSSISSISNEWRKKRPNASTENLSIILYNCQCLSTHIADLDILLSVYTPQIFILTGVGSSIKNLPKITSYYWISQEGTNSFGGVAMLIHNTLKTKITMQQSDFLLLEIDILPKPIFVGAIYVPPSKPFPQSLFDKFINKPFYIFGDYNAKHTDWMCRQNNASGSQLKNWLESTGCEMIYPTRPTSKRSTAVIDFGITHNAYGWKADVIQEGTSDHYPVLIKTPVSTGENNYFRKTNWKILQFFLQCVFQYFNSLVYNHDPDFFFDLFSSFLASLWDRVSEYVPINKYRPPWPQYLVKLARHHNILRKKYRRSRKQEHLENYLYIKNIYLNEKSLFMQQKIEERTSYISQGNNIWKYVHPTFHPYAPTFKGITTDMGIIKDHQLIADTLANFYEKHFESPSFDIGRIAHVEAIKNYEKISQLPIDPMTKITLEEVEKNWKRAQKKKSTDSEGISAFLLHKLPNEYLQIMTVAYNKVAKAGGVLQKSKHAKVICLSKDGLYPGVNKLRPISLLSNFGKC
ncbi:unnamed protein product, partial [Rotaria magnacalcarata]